MARVRNTNYQGGDPGSDFYKATSDSDPYSREQDTYGPAVALDGHDHGPGKGLPVTRVLAGSIDTDELADSSVTTDKLAANAVTRPKIGASAIGTTELDTAAVTLAKMANDSVGANQILTGAVGSTEIAADAVLLTNLAHGTGNRLFATAPDGTPSLLQLAAAMFPNGIVAAVALAAGAAAANLGYTPANLTGATFTGAISATVNANGAVAVTGHNQFAGAGGYGLGALNAAGNAWDLLLGHSSASFGVDITAPGVSVNGNPVYHAGNPPPSAGLFTNIVAGFAGTAGSIPAGWARETALNGRMMVFDGTMDSIVTWTQGTDYGSSWSHLHGVSTGHAHNLVSAGVSGSTGNAQGGNFYDEDETGTGRNTRDDSHNHAAGTLDVSGTTDGAGSFNTDSAAWTIPSRAYMPVKHT